MITRRSFLARGFQCAAASAAASHLLAAAEPGAASPAGGPWQIGCYTRPWAAFDYRTAMDAIARAGYKHVGLMTSSTKSKLVISGDTKPDEARQIGREARQRGLEIPSVYGGGFPLAESLEAGIEGLRRLIDACAAAGAKTLLLAGVAQEKLYDRYLKAVAECCDYAAQQRVGLVIKPHGGLNGTGPQLRKVVERVGKKNFSVWYDAGNVYYYNDGKVNPVDDASTLAGLVTGWCIKDCVLQPKKDVAITPGTGLVDFKAVFQRLKQGGFTAGPLLVETLKPGDAAALLEQARNTRKFLETLVSGNG